MYGQNSCVGKNLAPLQTEVTASRLGIANVPNLRCHLLYGLFKYEAQPVTPKQLSFFNPKNNCFGLYYKT